MVPDVLCRSGSAARGVVKPSRTYTLLLDVSALTTTERTYYLLVETPELHSEVDVIRDIKATAAPWCKTQLKTRLRTLTCLDLHT